MKPTISLAYVRCSWSEWTFSRLRTSQLAEFMYLRRTGITTGCQAGTIQRPQSSQSEYDQLRQVENRVYLFLPSFFQQISGKCIILLPTSVNAAPGQPAHRANVEGEASRVVECLQAANAVTSVQHRRHHHFNGAEVVCRSAAADDCMVHCRQSATNVFLIYLLQTAVTSNDDIIIYNIRVCVFRCGFQFTLAEDSANITLQCRAGHQPAKWLLYSGGNGLMARTLTLIRIMRQ